MWQGQDPKGTMRMILSICRCDNLPQYSVPGSFGRPRIRTEVRGLLCDLAEPLEVRIQVPASDSKSRALKCWSLRGMGPDMWLRNLTWTWMEDEAFVPPREHWADGMLTNCSGVPGQGWHLGFAAPTGMVRAGLRKRFPATRGGWARKPQ